MKAAIRPPCYSGDEAAVGGPFRDVAMHVVKSEGVGRKGCDRCALASIPTAPAIPAICAGRLQRIPPEIPRFGASAGCSLPLRAGRQSIIATCFLSQPRQIARIDVRPTHIDRRASAPPPSLVIGTPCKLRRERKRPIDRRSSRSLPMKRVFACSTSLARSVALAARSAINGGQSSQS